MDAHQVLGLPPEATLDDAEEAYKRLLRIHHPDLHQHDGAGALAAAELRTRAINEAIAHFRQVSRVATAPPHAPFDPGAWQNDPEEDPPLVACPLCGEWFATSVSLKTHVTTAHEVRLGGRRRRVPRPRLPAISLAVLAPINAIAALIACAVVNKLTGSAMIAVWVTALAMAPSAIQVFSDDR